MSQATNGQVSVSDLLKIVAEQKSMIDALMSQKDRKLGLKVSEKGAVCLTGLRRFPTTLYKREWLRVLDMADDIRAFIKANERLLADKTPANAE